MPIVRVSPVRKKVKRRVLFPSAGISQSQKKRLSGKSSHRERVLMRATLRRAAVKGTVAMSPNAPNSVADKWLEDHGWLNTKGNQAPVNRVNKLARSLRVRVPRNV